MAGDPTQQNVVLTADTSQYQQSMEQSASSTNKLLSSVTALSSAIGELTKRAGQRIEMVGVGTSAALMAATIQAGKFNDQMSQLQAQSVMTNRSFETMVRQTNNLRSEFGMSTTEIVNLVQQLNNLGQGQYNVQKLAETFVKLSAVTGESVSGLADGLITLQRQMGTTGVDQTEKYASALANLSAQAGTSAQGILQFANAIAPIGRVAGMTQNEVMGVATAFNKAGADGYGATNAFNKMLTDITRSIQYGSPDLAAYANLIGKTTDQFSKMNKTQAITQIFEQINSEGPAAIKTLDRLGLDGLKTMKSLQAVAQSGGIANAVQDATSGYNDPTKFNDAAAKAMDGLTEAGQRLKNTLAEIGEAFGAGLVKPLTFALNGITAILSPLASFLQLLGNIPGLATAAGAAMIGITGFGIANLGKLLTGATIAQAGQGFLSRGFMAGRAGNDVSKMKRPVANAYKSYTTPNEDGTMQGSRMQRAGYRIGNALGGGWQSLRTGGASLPEGSAAAEMSQQAAARNRFGIRTIPNAIIRGAGNFIGGSLETLRPSVQNDVFTRQPIFGGYGSTLKPVDFQNIQSKEGVNTATEGFRNAGKAAEEHGRLLRNTGSVLKTASNEMANVARYAAQSYAGAGMGLGRSAMGMVGKGLGALGSSALGMVGGVGGLAAMAGIGIYSAISSRNQNEDAAHNESLTATSADAAGGAYRQALGEAAKATTSFADIVNRAADSINPNQGANFSGVIDNSMMQRYSKHGNANYTDSKVSDMSDDQLKVYGQTAQMTPADMELFGYDVLKRTGGDKNRAQAILNSTKSTAPVDMQHLFEGVAGRDVWGMGSPTDQATQAQKYSQETLKQMYDNANAQGNTKLANQTLTTGFNAALAQSRKPDANIEQIADTINNQLGGDDKSHEAIQHYLSTANYEDASGSWKGMYKRIQAGTATPQEKMLYDAFKNSGLAGGAQFGTSVKVAPTVGNSAVLFSQLDSSSVAAARNSSAFGTYALSNNDLGKKIDLAANNTGNNEIVGQGVNAMAEKVQQFTGSFQGSIDALQKMQDSSQGASDVLIQMAASAEAVVRQQQQMAMHYNTQSTNLQTLQDNYNTTLTNSQKNPNTPGITDKLNQDKLALDQGKAGAFDRVMSISMGYRNLQTQQGYARTDYATSKTRSDDARKLQETRAQDDFTRQRDRSQAAYDLQVSNSQADFQRQRTRDEDSYQRQLSRTHRDYNLQRSNAQADFNKSRKRQEEDYQHSVVEMTKQTAKTVYDTYARVNVQRTWDSQNLLQNMADQQKRLDEQQANLKKLRGMGMSGDAISQLGLNDPANAQQLARTVDDLMSDPSLVKKFNESVSNRIKAAGKVVTDQDNEQWKEMQRSFKQNQDRSLTDFNQSLSRQDRQFNTQLADQRNERNISIAQQTADFNMQMARSATAFNLQMTHNRDDFNRNVQNQRTDYNTQMGYMAHDFQLQIDRANKAFQDSATDMTDQIGTLSTAAEKALTGAAKTQFTALLSFLDSANLTMTQKLQGMVTTAQTAVSQIAQSVWTATGSSSAAAGPSFNSKNEASDVGHGMPRAGGGLSHIVPGHPGITSGYGPRKGGFHHGIDLGVSSGTPVASSMPGRVVMTGFQAGGFGNHVRIAHANGIYSIYGHLSRYNVVAGQSVGGGQGIGESGSTGNSTGPHLHYEIRKGNAFSVNAAVNPSPWLLRSAGGGVYGTKLGDRVPVLAEAGEYVIPKHRSQDLGFAFLDALRANGIAGVKNHLINSNSVPNTAATTNYYQRIDKGNHFTGDICVHAADPMEFARKMEAQQRMKQLTGAR